MTLLDRSISRRQVLLGMSALPYAFAAAGESPLERTAALDLRPLRGRFKGDLIEPGDSGYEKARLTNNRAFDHHPALIARCLDADDVARGLDFARTNALPLAIRSGGHCQAGRSSCDAGIVIDLSRMDRVAVEGPSQRVLCGVGRGAGTDGLSCVRYGEVAGKLPPAGLDALLDPGNPPPIGRDITIDALHGVATRRKKSASAAPNYLPGFGTGYLVFWEDPSMTQTATAWTAAAWARVHPYTQAAYVNMLGNESEERVREAYGDNYSRAARLKKKYDPENVFRLNQNIKPA
jgi:FAD/FMN-containing dehydrogenase